MSPRRVALAAFGGVALFELIETLAYLWIRADSDRVRTVGGWFGLDPETQLARVHFQLAVVSVLLLIGSLAFVGISRGAPVALRWRRTAFIAFALYAIWAAVQQFTLAQVTPIGRVWLAAVTLMDGGLGLVGYLAAARALVAEVDLPFVLYDPLAHVEHSPSGLEWQEIKVGQGPLASPGRTAVVHYTGWLEDGTKFDSSYDRTRPFTFRVGAAEVIRGWDEGVQTMRQGGRRRLIVPPGMAYGSQANGAIPPDATLVFEVELIDVR